MSRRVCRLAAALVSLFIAGPVGAWEVEVLQQAGEPGNRIDLVVLGDGYRDVDQQQLSDDVAAFLADFWQAAPFGQYRYYFNVSLVHVVSNERGADNGSYGADRDTALGANYGCYGIDRLLCVDQGAVWAAASDHVPEFDVIFVIVNDPKYGGSGGPMAVFSIHDLAGEVAIHEFGHTFGGLADEYEDPYPGYPGCGADCPEPNATTRTERELIKWNPWIDAATPLPTPENAGWAAVVGLFEGARYQSSGVYRPALNCTMRALGAGFCAVCAEALVLAIYDQVSPIDATTPASPIALGACDSAELTVATPEPLPDELLVTWSVDGAPVQSGQRSHTLEGWNLAPGDHQVRVEVSDATAQVRNNPGGLLLAEHTWQVAVAAAGGAVCFIGQACYEAGTLDPSNPCRECRPELDPNGWSADDSNDCGDGLFCNGAEQCAAGVCQAGPPPCADDGLACTLDCEEDSRTCGVLQPGWCLIEDSCIAAGQSRPDNLCQSCQPDRDPRAWSADDAASCDDGLYCNGAEQCSAGECRSGQPPCVDDGLDCTADCDEATRSCGVLLPGWCLIDGSCVGAGAAAPDAPCSTCQPEQNAGAWSPADGTSCSDGVFCNGDERCVAGVCEAGAVPCGDDGLACTVDCDEAGRRCGLLQPGWCLIDGGCVAAGAASPADACLVCDPATDPGGWSRSADPDCADDPDPGAISGGCGCNQRRPGGAWWLVLLPLAGLVRRRSYTRRKTSLA